MAACHEWGDEIYWENQDVRAGQSSEGAKTIKVKWIYKTKLNKDGYVDKHKAQLVVKGFK